MNLKKKIKNILVQNNNLNVENINYFIINRKKNNSKLSDIYYFKGI